MHNPKQVKTMAMASELPAILPAIVAHRGASHQAPENTMTAVKLAWQLGADAVECDVRLSCDGQIVLHHDLTTERTAGIPRPVAEQTWEELQSLDVGSWKGPQWAGEPIPLLRNVIETIPDNKRLLIEIKCGPEIIRPLVTLLNDSGKSPEQTCIICFSWDVVKAMKTARPDLKVYWLQSFRQDQKTGTWSPSIEKIIEHAHAASVDGVDLQAAAPPLNEHAIAALRAANLEVHTWTVNDPALAHTLAQLGVDSITTDRPAWLAKHLADRLATESPSR